MTIHVISTGHNQPDEQVERLINSVTSQKVDYNLWIYNETDNDRRGAAYRRWEIMQNKDIQDDDICVLVGLDDHLLPGSLQRIIDEHERGAWVTYGNWQNQLGRINRVLCAWDGKHLRNGGYFLTAPNTFRAKLYRAIPIERLMVDDEWQHVCTEVEVMYACAEMAGPKRTKMITEPIYHYNERLPTGTVSVFGKLKKAEVLAKIQARQPFAMWG